MSNKTLLQGIFPEDVERLIRVEHPDPHGILGVHPHAGKEEGIVIRSFHPEAIRAEVLIDGKDPLPMEKCHPGGLFACFVARQSLPVHYRIRFIFSDGNHWESIA
ncbi:MAG: 1,4-alpha-glucan branching enzyme, partial [Deltaproteobacteria bacterium]|nr:1,4-alpha-glucan branching enzyme [Deltaproteobacteria bacterium]